MKSRLVASIALAAAVALGTAGCNFLTPQATLEQYDPSDGVNGQVGDVALRNVLFILGEDETANLLFTTVNSGDEEADLHVEVLLDGEAWDEQVEIPTGLTVFGGEEDAVIFEGIDLPDGGVVTVYFQYGEAEGVELPVPVLDGTLEEYRPYVPTPIPTPTQTLVPTDDETASPTPSPTATAGS